MKTFSKVIIFIFLTLCTVIGLAFSKMYEKYIANNQVVELFIRIIFFLIVLRCGLFFMVPLGQNILEYLHINISSVDWTALLFNPLLVVGVLGSAIYFTFKAE
jgi:hypothetical protein